MCAEVFHLAKNYPFCIFRATPIMTVSGEVPLEVCMAEVVVPMVVIGGFSIGW